MFFMSHESRLMKKVYRILFYEFSLNMKKADINFFYRIERQNLTSLIKEMMKVRVNLALPNFT
jgi:hypothetical protein